MSTEITVNELIARIKVMYLAVFANGEFDEQLKETLNNEFEELSLCDDARFMSRKLAQRIKTEFERDFHGTIDQIFISLEPLSARPECGHLLLMLYLSMVERDSEMTDAEEVLGMELAETLNLDIDYHLTNRTD